MSITDLACQVSNFNNYQYSLQNHWLTFAQLLKNTNVNHSKGIVAIKN